VQNHDLKRLTLKFEGGSVDTAVDQPRSP
jgi:hypothetical protein